MKIRLFLTTSVLSLASGDTCVESTFQKGIGYHGDGQGVGHVNGTSALDCCNQCNSAEWKAKGCLAFGFAIKDKMCWFKKVQKGPRKDPNIISGRCDGTSPPTPAPVLPTPKPAPTPSPPTPPPTPVPATPPPTPYDGKPVQVFIMMGQSNMLGEGKVTGLSTNNTLEHAVFVDNMYPYLKDEKNNNWAVADQVRNVFIMTSGNATFNQSTLQDNEWMQAPDGKVVGSKKSSIGPELGIGFSLANVTSLGHVMTLKSCIGNRALGWDILPPGSPSWEVTDTKGVVHTYAGYGQAPRNWVKGGPIKPTSGGVASWYAGKQWDGDTANALHILDNLSTYYPGATKYEVAGFFWWQGDKDSRDMGLAGHYEENLVNFIKAVRTTFKAKPNAPFVTASLGQTVKGSTGGDGLILDAMLAVDGTSGKYPDFKGNVAAVYTHPLLNTPGSSGAHYGRDAKTYMNVGEAMGAAMVKLLQGQQQ